jgi:hypothetical protein
VTTTSRRILKEYIQCLDADEIQVGAAGSGHKYKEDTQLWMLMRSWYRSTSSA